MKNPFWRQCIGVVLLGAALASCAAPQPPTPAAPTSVPAAQASPAPRPSAPTSAPAARATAGPAALDLEMLDILSRPTLARGYLTTPNELTRIARLAQAGIEPYQTTVAEELEYAERALDAKALRMPKEIDIRNDDIENPQYLHDGSQYVYTWALAYNLLKEREPELAQTYAEAAHTLVMEMPEADVQVSGYQENTRLNISSHIQNWVYAADLLADWPTGDGTPFAQSADAKLLKTWLGSAIVRYPYNVGHVRANNWGAWGRSTTAVIADYVGGDAPLYVQQLAKDEQGAYDVDPSAPCDAEGVDTCVVVEAGAMYATAIQLHYDYVDGRISEFTSSSCDGNGSKSMIRPDGGMPDEIRRSYECDTTRLEEPYDAAARYSQFALDAMISLAELAWRRGDPSVYTHIDAETGRGSIYRALSFLIDNNVTFEHGAILEIANRFYTYQAGVEQDAERLAELRELLEHDLPGILKSQDEWPADVNWLHFGTLTHGFSADEVLRPPPTVAPR
jgi:hypothetical protein